MKYQIAFIKATLKAILKDQNLRNTNNQAEERWEEFERTLKGRLKKVFMSVESSRMD